VSRWMANLNGGHLIADALSPLLETLLVKPASCALCAKMLAMPMVLSILVAG